MSKEFWIFTVLGVALVGTCIGLSQYNTNKDRQLKEKEAENKRFIIRSLLLSR